MSNNADAEISTLQTGTAIMLTLLGIGGIIYILSTFIFGSLLPVTNTEAVTGGTLHIRMADGLFWGILYGAIVMVPLLIKLTYSICDYKDRIMPRETSLPFFFGLGNLVIFAWYSVTVSTMFKYAEKATGVSLGDASGLAGACIVVMILCIVCKIVTDVIDMKNMMRINADNDLFEESEVKTNE